MRADIAEGQAAGVTGTPSQKIRGAQPYAAFKQAIDEALAELAKPAGSG